MRLMARVKFYCRSFHLHGVHSPFVYELTRFCIPNKKAYPTDRGLKNFRKELLENTPKSKPISLKNARFLNRLTVYLKIKNSLELGFSEGLETFAILLGNNRKIQVVSFKNIPEFSKKWLLFAGISKIDWTSENTVRFLEAGKNKRVQYDLIYFHKNPRPENTFSLFKKALPLVHNNSVFIFENIHVSREMELIWTKIKENMEVKMTIDTFQFGLVFFRKEQAKEHFYIRV